MILSRPNIKLSHLFSLVDVVILAALGALLFGILSIGQQWSATMRPVVEIDLSPSALPRYTLLSLFRGFVAYGMSLIFTLIYGRVAAYNKRAEKLMMPLLDILQSIPVLGFLPGLVLALVAIFPHSNTGLELACILMIFTGQAWNMTFSFYQSLRSIPPDLCDASLVYRQTVWQRFLQLEVPSGTVGLVWNSMMSMAGGWFFLTVCEAFSLGDKDFRLPGIGSYMSVAIAQRNWPAMIWAVVAMVVMIVAVDWLFWRPIVAWSQKFKLEETEAAEAPKSFILDMLRESRLLRWLDSKVWEPLVALGRPKPTAAVLAPSVPTAARTAKTWLLRLLAWSVALAVMAGVVWGTIKVVMLLTTLSGQTWLEVFGATGLTFIRVLMAIALGTIWTLPAGVVIGMNPRISKFFQPIIQVMASFPAPMLFPLVILVLKMIGIGIDVGSMFLMLMGTQWYILFNVIAGAMALPGDLREAATVYRLTGWERWRRLILPGVFPYLVTGWVTAAGGAWNASIVAEYVHFGDETLVAHGLGSTISVATDKAQFALLAASILVMCVTVVGINRLFWRRLYGLAERKYAMVT